MSSPTMTRSPETAAMVYVAGFVDVVSYPKVDRLLILETSEVAKFLPLVDPIPLNIEHLEKGDIGVVLNMFQVTHGLFMVGIINSPSFLDLATSLFSKSVVARTKVTPLPSDPLIESLHAWLPELSLSSLNPQVDTPSKPATIFQHVALCALGRRRGTVAVYGHTLDWVLSKFTSLTTQEMNSILDSLKNLDPRTLPCPEFNINLESLLAKAIDAGFILNRLDLLKTDRSVAAVQGSVYLKASDTPKVGNPDPSTMNPTPQLPQAQMPQEDLISIPKSTFLSMIQSNLDHRQSVPASRTVMQQPSGFQTLYVPQGFGVPAIPETYISGTLPDFPRIQQPNIPYYFPNYHFPTDHYPYFPGYQHFPPRHGPSSSRSNKRKRDNDSDGESEEPLFPGEGKSLYKDLLTLSKNVAELQSELKDLRQTTTPGLYPPTFVPPYHIPYSPYQPPLDNAPINPPPPAVPAQAPPNPPQAPPVRQDPNPSTESTPADQPQPKAIEASHLYKPVIAHFDLVKKKMFCDEMVSK
ncbi:putative assembly protein [Marmot herpesvirus 1]|nr:putative assembly protein [Marmot herpesvirus 1]